jgi:hypothetical protein
MKIISGTELKERQKSLREHFPDPIGLRVHRAICEIARNSRPVGSDFRFQN